MKICNAEAMKKIKGLEEELSKIKFTETAYSIVSYKEGETKQPTTYDYKTTRESVDSINAQIRKIKHALAVANSTYIIDDFNITIGEALIYLAQLNTEYNTLSSLSNRQKISRRITNNGVIEYSECAYDPESVKVEQKALYEKIGKLQVSIDRANLNCFIEL